MNIMWNSISIIDISSDILQLCYLDHMMSFKPVTTFRISYGITLRDTSSHIVW